MSEAGELEAMAAAARKEAEEYWKARHQRLVAEATARYNAGLSVTRPDSQRPKETQRHLSERNRKVLKLNRDGYSSREIGNMFGLTPQRINQIIRTKAPV